MGYVNVECIKEALENQKQEIKDCRKEIRHEISCNRFNNAFAVGRYLIECNHAIKVLEKILENAKDVDVIKPQEECTCKDCKNGTKDCDYGLAFEQAHCEIGNGPINLNKKPCRGFFHKQNLMP